MNHKLIGHAAIMLIGFAAAGLVAALPIEIAELVQTPAKLADPVKRLSTFGWGVLGILAFAFPVWLAFAIFSEAGSVRKLRWHATAGVVAALFPVLMFGALGNLFADSPWRLLTIFLSGMAGGAAYWAVAGRNAGEWRSRDVQMAAPTGSTVR